MRTRINILIGVLLATLAIAVVFPFILPPKVHVVSKERAVQFNLHQFKKVSFLYMTDHDVNLVAYSDVFGPGKYDETPLRSRIGEDYNDLSITDTDTEISITTNDDRTISIEFESYNEVTANIGIE